MLQPFKADIEKIRERARAHMEEGAVTSDLREDVSKVIDVLQETLATEIVCTLRYKAHYYATQGIGGEVAAKEFLEHATEEQEHADRIASRIAQLGGQPNFNPEGLLARGHAGYSVGDSLKEMIEEDLVAERIAIETYGEIVRWLGDRDPTTRRIMEDILAQEEEHADDMLSLLQKMKG